MMSRSISRLKRYDTIYLQALPQSNTLTAVLLITKIFNNKLINDVKINFEIKRELF